MSTRAFAWFIANMVLLYSLGVIATSSKLPAWALFVIGMLVGHISYRIAKRMIVHG